MFQDTQGVIQIKKTDLNPLFVFIKPPSMEELERRLRGRQTETEESIQRCVVHRFHIKSNFLKTGNGNEYLDMKCLLLFPVGKIP